MIGHRFGAITFAEAILQRACYSRGVANVRLLAE